MVLMPMASSLSRSEKDLWMPNDLVQEEGRFLKPVIKANLVSEEARFLQTCKGTRLCVPFARNGCRQA